MSVIAVKKTRESIVLAGDSISVSKGFIKRIANEKLTKEPNEESKIMNNVKLFQSPEQGLMIGSVGWVMQTSFIQIYSKYHQPKGSDTDNILDYFCDFYKWAKEKDERFEPSNEYIICFKDNVFKLSDAYLVEEIHDHDAIGVGESFALTALELGKSPKEAVEIACKLCLYCSLPVVELVKFI